MLRVAWLLSLSVLAAPQPSPACFCEDTQLAWRSLDRDLADMLRDLAMGADSLAHRSVELISRTCLISL
jgi:hypothetical protein